jgi:VanZ family protein
VHKKLALALLIIYVLLLTILSLISIGGVPRLGSSIDDKIYHFIAYTIFTILCFNLLNTPQVKYKISISVVIAIIYGIIIEVLQSVISNSRTSDFYDVVANSLGVVFGVIVIGFFRNRKLK